MTWPRIDVTVDAVVFAANNTTEPSVLLIQRKNEPFKDCWAFPGGFVDQDEDLEHAALRELEEETGLQLKSMTQLRAFGAPDRDPRKRIISIAHGAIIESDEMVEIKANDDAKEAKWFPLSQLPKLAFDHQEILQIAHDWFKRN